mmetsp:Transcript_5551/g.7500  ORF Transcript_5551/g.7500 Transcript_5551/m.7500 type:complete len:195 (-) Transcript_5551:170-754(-)
MDPGKHPTFVKIPGTVGTIALWHFPSTHQMKLAKGLGCTHVVTLQSESENIASVQTSCASLGIEWIHLDFWRVFMPVDSNHIVLALADQLINLLKSSANIMIHCAAGVHRTGTLSYIIMRRLGMPMQEAYNFLHVLRPVTRIHVGDSRIQTAENQFKRWFVGGSSHEANAPETIMDHRATRRDREICSEVNGLK